MVASVSPKHGRAVGRYCLYGELASGGTATVHLGRLLGPAGFSRTVAIKRLHSHLAKDPAFVSMFLDEARLAARVRHPNVVPIVDVIADEGEVFLVMDYVHGETLSKVWRSTSAEGMRPPLAIVSGIMCDILHGLHAAHEATDEQGEPLHIIHRDVSPQNILVGADGISRVLDFGVAKATWRLHTTRDGSIKGKLRYMAPEQLMGEVVDRRVDVFSASVVLWELLTGTRLFSGEEPTVYVKRLTGERLPSPRSIVPELAAPLEAAVMRGLASDPEIRFSTARDMATALAATLAPATPREIGAWVEGALRAELDAKAKAVADIERSAPNAAPLPSLPKNFDEEVEKGEARVLRSRLPTEVSLTNAQAVAALESAAAPESAATVGAAMTVPSDLIAEPSPPGRRRPALWIGTGLVLVLVGAGVVSRAAWRRAPQEESHEVRPSPTDPPAATSPPPTDPPVVQAAPPPSEEPASAKPTMHPRNPPSPKAARPASPSGAKTTPSASSGLCMKSRADGIVYFEPCP